jgi:L-lactate dehydrogenase
MINIQKCAIIGCGFVGATTAYSLMKSEMFSEIVLIDIDRKKAEGEAADMTHGLPFIAPMEIYAGDYSDIADASIIIITAGANQKPNETRLDLVKRNNKIFQSIIKNIVKYNQNGIIIVVTNPVDILTYATIAYSGFPKHRVIGSGTVLDTARLKYLVGRHLEIDPRNVHTFIIGEHGDSEVAVWSSANISGIDLDSYCQNTANKCDMTMLNNIFENVKTSAYKIISAKNATYYAIAESVKKIVSSIVRDENTVLPVSTLINGHYGISDICLGVPCIVGSAGIKEILEIPLNDYEQNMLELSAQKIKKVIEDLNLTCRV